MLNAKALGDVLTKNRDGRLCKRWYLMTPNGTLLAYSRPTELKDIRKRVAVAAMAWQEQEAGLRPGSPDSTNDQAASSGARQLQTLIMEAENDNTLMCKIQGQLLLVLEGGVPPRKRGFEQRITAEGVDGVVHSVGGSRRAESGLDSSVSSLAESSRGSIAGTSSVLGHHRKKLEAMAAAINNDFDSRGFHMPDDVAAKYF